jgi:putative phosphoesterase
MANAAGCDSIIWCGDICSSFIIDHFHSGWDKPVHIIFGNNDGDRFSIQKKSSRLNHDRKENNFIYIHGEFILADRGHQLAGIPAHFSIAVFHHPDPAMALFRSSEFNYIFFGHTHTSFLDKKNGCLVANPGSLMGYVSGDDRKFVDPTCLIINWENGEADLISF